MFSDGTNQTSPVRVWAKRKEGPKKTINKQRIMINRKHFIQ
jgi:hypothetical protein